MTVLAERMPDVRSVTIGVWLRKGSRDETADVNGISHFLEHLVFKGTETRTAREIALAMDSVGGQIDAFTSKEYTCFYAKVLDEHLDIAVDLLADIVQRPRFDPEEIERERRVVLEEIKMIDDSPEDLIHDLLSASVYAGHSLGRPIQGTARTVGAMTRRRLAAFFRRAYRPENMLIAAAGNLELTPFFRTIRRVFGDLAPGPRKVTGKRAPRHLPVLVKRTRREIEQLHVLLSVPADAEGSPRRYPLYVLNTLLGGTMSSRLFQRIREERGLAYSVYSGLHGFRDAGSLLVSAATDPDRAGELVRLVLAELRSLAAEGPSEEELGVAKEHLKGSLVLSLESTSARMSNLARQEIYLGEQVSFAQTIRRVDRVRRDEVHALAGELFRGRHAALAAVGPVGKLSVRKQALAL